MTTGVIDRFRTLPISSGRRAHRPRRGERRAQRPLDACSCSAWRCIAGFRPVADLTNWLAVAGLLLALMTAVSWLAACFGLLARSVEAANAATFVAAFAPYVSSAFVPADTMPAGLQWIADHQPVTPIADTLRALMLDAPVGNTGLVALAWCLGGDRDRPRRRRLPVPTSLTHTLRRCSASTPPPSAGSRSATSGSTGRSRGRKPTAQDLLETVAARCAACSSTRRRSSPARTCSCSSAATARSTRRCSRSSPTSERALFEYWAHEASYVLSEDLPIHRWAMRPPSGGAWRAKQNAWWEAEHEFRAHILERLERGGPAARARHRRPRDRPTGERPTTAAGRGPPNVARMLDLMWVRGQVGISRRDGAQRVWDLLERCLPADAPREELSDEEVTRRAVPYALRALGAGRIPHIRAHFTRGRYPHLAGGPRGAAEGGRGRAHRGRRPRRRLVDQHATTSRRSTTTSSPAPRCCRPFDNLLCDRARTEALFGFTHRLEIYTPQAKRRWGYFVLPVLDGDRLVARIDLAMDRKRNVLVAREVYAEPKVPRGQRLPKAIRRELERLAAWRGADRDRGAGGTTRMARSARRLTRFSLPSQLDSGRVARSLGLGLRARTEGVKTWTFEGCAPLARHWSRSR